MRRRTRLVLVLVALAIVVGGAAAIVLSTKPGLDDARERVDDRWTPLRKPLQLRYQVLAGVEQAVTAAGGGERAVIKELRHAFDRWAKLAGQGDAQADPGAEAEAANGLEALARRLRANITQSERLKGVPEIDAALKLFDAAVVPPPQVQAYNRAVRSYQKEREGKLAGIVADVFGYEARPVLVLGG